MICIFKILNKYFIGQLLLQKPAVELIKRQLKKIHPNLNAEIADIYHIIHDQVLSPEVIESIDAKDI
ncbi:MAG: hypothetical protein A2Y15_05925 [Clostridiales bacterium GWF2_36_10]|nr:MAG: hypothetical protein A2Y15_05925 [Clostridiales bacterium GWF2_36_10]HAN21604.1 hypothetical protein [Clostridiales bacterium]